MEEIWKPYKKKFGNTKYYRTELEISNFGNVRGTKYDSKPFTQDVVKIKNGRRFIGNESNLIYKIVYSLFVGNVPNGYVLHHKDHNKLNDRLDNLQLMSREEHTSHHFNGIHRTEEFKEKVSKGLTGVKHSEERRRKDSLAKQGIKWFNNGTTEIMQKECPEGFEPGRLRKNKF